MNSQFQVLLYYKYVSLPNPQQVMIDQRKLCESLKLKGRVIVAPEGINGTVEGKIEDTEKYIDLMKENEYFKDIHFKKSEGTGNAFPKLSIKVRPEIVTAKVKVNPMKKAGQYISPELLHEWFETKKFFYIVDMRNDYEYISGQFENSVLSGIHNFFDLPNVLSHLNGLKNKTIVTVCTGGVRCEKASGFLLENGFNDVYQLEGGIVTYMEKYPNEHFKGKLYVFDNRLTMGFNIDDPKHEIIGRCLHCQKPSDLYVNCEYTICHYHYICCMDCRDKETGLAFDKKECKEKYFSQNKKRHAELVSAPPM